MEFSIWWWWWWRSFSFLFFFCVPLQILNTLGIWNTFTINVKLIIIKNVAKARQFIFYLAGCMCVRECLICFKLFSCTLRSDVSIIFGASSFPSTDFFILFFFFRFCYCHSKKTWHAEARNAFVFVLCVFTIIDWKELNVNYQFSKIKKKHVSARTFGARLSFSLETCRRRTPNAILTKHLRFLLFLLFRIEIMVRFHQ